MPSVIQILSDDVTIKPEYDEQAQTNEDGEQPWNHQISEHRAPHHHVAETRSQFGMIGGVCSRSGHILGLSDPFRILGTIRGSSFSSVTATT